MDPEPLRELCQGILEEDKAINWIHDAANGYRLAEDTERYYSTKKSRDLLAAGRKMVRQTRFNLKKTIDQIDNWEINAKQEEERLNVIQNVITQAMIRHGLLDAVINMPNELKRAPYDDHHIKKSSTPINPPPSSSPNPERASPSTLLANLHIAPPIAENATQGEEARRNPIPP